MKNKTFLLHDVPVKVCKKNKVLKCTRFEIINYSFLIINYSFAVLCLFCTFQLSAQTTGDQIFDNSYIHEIRIESDDPNLLSSLYTDWTDSLFTGSFPYRSVNITIDGVTLDSVGIRVKGASSVLSSNKRPLKLDFNRFINGQKYDGLRKINLHNMDRDKSYQRELLTYDIFKWAGVKGGRCGYTQIYVNDVLQGMYLLVEQIDKTFMQHYYASDEGTFYKAKFDGVGVLYNSGVMDEYNEMLDVAMNTPTDELKNKLDTILDTDNFLKLMVVLILTNSVDNAIANVNFSLYHEPKSSLLNWVPWDLNLSLFPWANFALDYSSFNPTFNAMMNVSAYRERYNELACEMLQYNFTVDRLHALIDKNASLIRDSVMIDPFLTPSIDTFDIETQQLKDLMVSRVNEIQEDLSEINFACQDLIAPINFQDIVINEFVASSDSVAGIAEPNGGYPDWIELYNNTNTDVVLDKFYLSDDIDFLKHWKFPTGTMIPANGYLMVWADRDVEEEGLHTDFKLNKNSGRLFLTYEDMTILDSVTYSTQVTNVSSARIPNGVGDFTPQTSTFNMFNEIMIAAENILKQFDFQVFPNPANDYLNLEIIGEIPNETQIRITDIFGKVMLQRSDVKSKLSINIQNYPSSIYAIEIFSPKKISIKKIIIQH